MGTLQLQDMERQLDLALQVWQLRRVQKGLVLVSMHVGQLVLLVQARCV
jgi:hypothetical protein